MRVKEFSLKIYTTKINESWIVDRIKKEWVLYNKQFNTNFKLLANIVWVIAPWSFSDKDFRKFKNKKLFAQSIILKIPKKTVQK